MVKHARRLRPSAGFVLMIGSYVFTVAFMAWGYRQPPLDRGWHVIQRMQREDFAGLTEDESELLQSLLRTHPQFPRVLIGRSPLGFVEPSDQGWIALSRSHLLLQGVTGKQLEVVIECRAERSAFPVSISFEARSHRETIEFAEDGWRRLDWSDKVAPAPVWVTVDVRSNATSAHVGARPEIRVRVAGANSAEDEP